MAIPVRPATSDRRPADTIGFSLCLETRPVVLLLEPDAEAGARLETELEHSGYRVRSAVTTAELLGELGAAPESLDLPALVVVSVLQNDASVLDILESIERSSGLPPCIALIPVGRDDLRDRAFEAGVTAVVEKPCAPQTVAAIAAEEVPAERVIAC